MSKLKAIDPKSAKKSKAKIMIFGGAGSGKTWTSLDFPSVFYIDTEGGATEDRYTDKLKKSGGGYFGVEEGSLSFELVLEQVKALATEKHRYKTIVIDSISKLYQLEIAKEAERLGDKDAFGASKKPAIAYMRQLISWFARMDMNVILIAHEKTQWGKDERGQQAAIGVTFDAWEKLEYELDLVLNTFEIAGQHKARVTKSRFATFKKAEVIKWNYDDFAEKFGREVLEGEVKQVILATPEQLDELSDLLERVKLPAGQQTRWFKATNCATWQEMDSENVAKILSHIKTKYLKPLTEKELK